LAQDRPQFVYVNFSQKGESLPLQIKRPHAAAEDDVVRS
jgi:hypothetical protein